MSLSSRPLRVGLFGIGLDTYWPQFPGLETRLRGFVDQLARKIERPNVEIVNLGLVDSPPRALEAGHEFRRQDVDVLFLFATTYALSSTVLHVVQRARVPVIVLNLQPERAIDYPRFNALGDRTAMTGEWLAFCGACPVPEIANVFARCGIAFHQISGTLEGDAHVERQIESWLQAAQIQNTLSHNRMGVMGHAYNGMLDIYSDLTLQVATWGGHIEIVEVDELTAMRRDVSNTQIAQRVALFHREFNVQPDCSSEELQRAARTSVALDRFVDEHDLGSLAYYYMGVGTENDDTLSSIILGTSLLTARGVPVAGELEIKNVQAMKILDCLNVGGSFTEFYALDWNDDIVLMGHDGPGHIQIAQGQTKVKPLHVYHGKVGRGLSVEMSVKHGPVTLLSVVESGTKLKLLVAHGESVPGPILEIGNTNSRYRFSIGARAFVDTWNAQGPAHHCAVGIGHVGDTLEKLGRLLGIEVARVC